MTQPHNGFTIWDLFGYLPGVLFLTAFSVNIHTLANVYATIATLTYFGLQTNLIFLVLCNIIVYIILIVSFILPLSTVIRLYFWALAGVEFLIACLCLFYAFLLHRQAHISPLSRLLVASFICFLCFCSKSILIFIIQIEYDGGFPPVLLLCYFIISEIIPIVVMLIIFENSGKRNLIPNQNDTMMSEKIGSTFTGTVDESAYVFQEDNEPEPSFDYVNQQ